MLAPPTMFDEMTDPYVLSPNVDYGVNSVMKWHGRQVAQQT